MTAPPPRARKAAISFIFITVVLDVLAMGVILPILPNLVKSFLGGETSRAAIVYGAFATVWGLMQFFFSPIIGVLSDRFGRRPVILLSNLGLGLDYILMALSPNIAWLFVGRVISGITGASFTTAFAYIADVTPAAERAAGIGKVGAAWGLGFVLGPALGGLLGGFDPRLPFWVAAVLTLLNACYGFFVLPESLDAAHRKPFEWRRANPVGALRLLRSHRDLLGLATVNFLYYTAHQVLPAVFVLYAGYRYGWGERAVGLTLALVGILNATVQGGLVRPIVGRFGERRPLLVGLFCGAVGMVLFGAAPTGTLFLAALPVLMMIGFVSPSAQALMTRCVSPSEQGQLQGANSSLMALAGLLGPAVFSVIFAAAISHPAWHLPGAPYFLAAAIELAAMFLAIKVTRIGHSS